MGEVFQAQGTESTPRPTEPFCPWPTCRRRSLTGSPWKPEPRGASRAIPWERAAQRAFEVYSFFLAQGVRSEKLSCTALSPLDKGSTLTVRFTREVMRRLPEHGSVKSRWQLTFSDMSTLLLTFFVLLFGLSFSPPEGTRGSEALPKPPGRGKALPLQGNIILIPGVPLVNLTEEGSTWPTTFRRGSQRLLRQGGDEPPLLPGSVNLSIGSTLLFPPNGTRLNPDGYTLLESLAETLRPLSQRILIEGHTDETISPKRTNQWLSLQRAWRSSPFSKQGLCGGEVGHCRVRLLPSPLHR